MVGEYFPAKLHPLVGCSVERRRGQTLYSVTNDLIILVRKDFDHLCRVI